ncbi:MAG: HlyD family efflux transporter periplasmic adaptor subunit [Planctomycetaceae bacterium]|nr:HlyD family efflux transporter periplasmic adaptor subunit [Planctomycetaceae bacterium]
MVRRDDLDLKQLAVRREENGHARLAPKRRVVSRYVLPGMLIAGFVGMLGWAARDAYLPRRPVTVVPVMVSVADVQTAGTPLFKAAGWVEPRPTPTRVTALADGVVEQLLVVEDQLVAAGDPIALLVRRDAELALERARAHQTILATDIDQAKAVLAAAQVRFDVPAHLELPLAEADAALAAIDTELSNLPFVTERARVKLRVAQQDLTTKSKVGEAIPAILLLQSQGTFDAAQAELNELEKRESVLQNQRAAFQRSRDAAAKRLELKVDELQAVDSGRAALASAEAHLQEANVAVTEAELQLERMTIRAPVAGRILDLVAGPGTQLMSNGLSLVEGRDSGTVVTMYQPDHLQVRVDVRFEDLPRVGGEQPVQIESPAVGVPMHGKVLFLTGSANIQKNTLGVKVSIDAPPGVLKPEMLVDVTFLAPESEQPAEATDEYRLFIPRPLVESAESGSEVWVADLSSGVARRVPITLGDVQTPALVEVKQGLTAASRLISTGRERLEDGMRIAVTGEDAAVGSEATLPSSSSGPPAAHH